MEKGADANALGRANDKKVTPLHMAESPKIVELLVEYEADTNAIMIHAKKKASVFDSLLRRNPKAAEGLLDCFIGSNDEDLDSPYLQITFDYAFLIDESIECLGREDETFVPNKILDLDDHSLLDHPLISSMLHFCSLFVSDLYFMWIFFYGLCYLLPVNFLYMIMKERVIEEKSNDDDVDDNGSFTIENIIAYCTFIIAFLYITLTFINGICFYIQMKKVNPKRSHPRCLYLLFKGM